MAGGQGERLLRVCFCVVAPRAPEALDVSVAPCSVLSLLPFPPPAPRSLPRGTLCLLFCHTASVGHVFPPSPPCLIVGGWVCGERVQDVKLGGVTGSGSGGARQRKGWGILQQRKREDVSVLFGVVLYVSVRLGSVRFGTSRYVSVSFGTCQSVFGTSECPLRSVP